jgi:hypothetical protein
MITRTLISPNRAIDASNDQVLGRLRTQKEMIEPHAFIV